MQDGRREPQALAVVRGLGGLEWLVQALQQAGKFSIDFGGPLAFLDAEAVEKYGLETYQNNAGEKHADAR